MLTTRFARPSELVGQANGRKKVPVIKEQAEKENSELREMKRQFRGKRRGIGKKERPDPSEWALSGPIAAFTMASFTSEDNGSEGSWEPF